MNSKMTRELSALRTLVLLVTNRYRENNTYPVLGAEGNQFFVEISSGIMESRVIHSTFYIFFDGNGGSEWLNYQAVLPEMTINLPDASYLVALISLLCAALGNEPRVLHPLDSFGNYLVGWQQALTAVSEKSS